MRLIDADAHVEESDATFGDDYLDPAFRSQRPQVVAMNDLIYWAIEEQLFPRRTGRGCHNLGTPTHCDDKVAPYAAGKSDTIPSMELTDIQERLRSMEEEDIDLQVIYPTLFLAYPLTVNPFLLTALTTSYNRFLGDRLGKNEKIKWAAVVNLDDIRGAVQQVREAKKLGAVAAMVLGTAGDRMLDDPSHLPFYETVAEENLSLAIHVGWSCPSLSNLFTHIYPSSVNAFLLPLLLGFSAMITSGLLDRFPNLRDGLSRGRLPVDSLHARPPRAPLQTLQGSGKFSGRSGLQERSSLPWSTSGVGISTSAREVEDGLLPQVIDLVGEGQILLGSDMPHGDRERYTGRTLEERGDLGDSAKHKMAAENPVRYYQLNI